MAQSIHITTEKSRWLKAVLGLGYTKEGLASFCEDIAEKQHKDILDNIKQKKGILNKKCPRKHDNCCFLSPVSVESCSIYDIIKGYYTSSNKPNLKNTEPHDWMKDPWSIAKCFIYTSGYKDKKSAADTDITGLLHVMINNKYFHGHVSCIFNGSDIFSKVRDNRNEILHSHTQMLDKKNLDNYIDNMIAVFQDGKELLYRQDAQGAVKKLQDLKNENFIITTEHVKKVLEDIKEDVRLIKETTEGLATKDDVEDLKSSVISIESLLIQNREQRKTDYDSSKADLQKKLLKVYRDYILHMPAMPCHPDHACIFEDIYVTPRITLKTKEKKSKDIETKMSDVFFKDDKPFKSIYILGEAGSGKSSFCKSLISFWCKAHSDTQYLDGKTIEHCTEDHADLLHVMKKFNFLFFLFLRDYIHTVSINDMLEKENENHPVLKELLERESETCLIVLDGLDEWTTLPNCPPKRAKLSNYTVLTTSRPWKIESLGISQNYKQQVIYLSGFDDSSKNKLITNILKILQKQYPDNKKAKDKDVSQECVKLLSKNPFRNMTHTAMMLQQLICLWFEDRLHATSRCNLYTCMLDLIFVWYKQKDPKSLEKMLDKSSVLELPEYLNDTDECRLHSYIIKNVSRLAYETLIKNEKETSLTFDSSMFQKLNISNYIKDCCLGLGILSEETGQRLSPSRSRKLHISFTHKSMQEYLAAMHIVWNIHNGRESENLSQMLNIKTLDELLEQENVLIMLCGMDTIMAQSVSRFIFNTVAKDDRVVKYRKTIDDGIIGVSFTGHIQKFILDCAEETKACGKLHQLSFDLGDLVVDKFQNYPRRIDDIVQNITLEKVISIELHTQYEEREYVGRTLDCMTKCKQLKTIKLDVDFDEEVNKRICGSIDANASTLKCLSLSYNSNFFNAPAVSTSPFRHIADMTQLVALKVKGLTMTCADFTSLCTFLSGTGNLQQIYIHMECKRSHQHEVDLSKHKQLQYLEYSDPVVVTNVEGTNLEVINGFSLNKINCIKILDSLSNSMKIKEMYLLSDRVIDFSKQNLLRQHDYHTTITSKLTNVISLSLQLRLLDLNGFTFTDNIITCPSKMKSLVSIEFTSGKMSLTIWRKFVDSVAELPQPVEVGAWSMCITRDGEECNPYIDSEMGGGEEAAALQYVRERVALFDVSNESEDSIEFSVKK